MKQILLFSLAFLFGNSLVAQSSTAERVYQIFQQKCVNCHSNANPRGGLDLEGSGSTTTAKINSIYSKLVNTTPKNVTAASKDYKLIAPGRIDKSFLFKKINNGLDRDMELDAGEKAPMPMSGSMTDVEKELVRQWILFGAPKDKIVVKEEMLVDYYENGKGKASFPEGAPPAPDPSEGFQIKMGPFFLDEAGEDEYYTKYQLDNQEEIEINRLDIQMSNFSHHFIIYDYSSAATQVPEGFRLDQDHTQDVSFVATVQESNDIVLPRKTAFAWSKNHVLDLNSHTINYTAGEIYQNEVYINVYTQPTGTAAQIMQAELVPYPWINIPNNGNEVSFNANVQFPGKLFLWNTTGHTHQLGNSYKIWMNDENGEADELVYDASCPRGIPGCVAPFYDYQHIPTRTFDNFLPVDFSKGITHEASYINDGDKRIFWGSTSKDEMMLFAMLYLEDTTGLGVALTTPTFEIENPLEKIKVMPNPMENFTNIVLPEGIGKVQFRLFDVLGKEYLQLTDFSNPFIRVDRGNLTNGLYLFTVEDKNGHSYTGKILME